MFQEAKTGLTRLLLIVKDGVTIEVERVGCRAGGPK